jgi:hypothetical protein
MSGDLFGFCAALLVLATGLLWVQKLRTVRIPTNRVPYLSAMGLGVGLGVLAFLQGSGVAGGVAAAFAMAAGGIFVGLRLQSRQEPRPPGVHVGDRLLPFTAPDEHGQAFSSASLQGQPFLLKFFRGHW